MGCGPTCAAVAGVLVAFCGTLGAQTTDVRDLGLGKVLVMQQPALDPVFAESVILLIQYGPDGVVGLTLNRPADVPVSRLHDLAGTSRRSDPLYLGGPVQTDGIMSLIHASKAPRQGLHVSGDIYAVVTKRDLESALKVSKGPDDLRIFLGYCGWTVPQLQNEVRQGGWYIFDHGERFAFDSMPRTLWKRLIEQTGLRRVAFPAEKGSVPFFRARDSIRRARALPPESRTGATASRSETLDPWGRRKKPGRCGSTPLAPSRE